MTPEDLPLKRIFVLDALLRLRGEPSLHLVSPERFLYHCFKELALHLRVPSLKTFLAPAQERKKNITRMALISEKPGFKH